MRTNVVIDDTLMQQAMRLTGARTKKEVIHQALKLLVESKAKEGLLHLAGQVSWEGDLDALRENAFRHDIEPSH